MEKTTGRIVCVPEKVLDGIKQEMQERETEMDRTKQYLADSIISSVGQDIMETLAKKEKEPSWLRKLIDRISNTVI